MTNAEPNYWVTTGDSAYVLISDRDGGVIGSFESEAEANAERDRLNGAAEPSGYAAMVDRIAGNDHTADSARVQRGHLAHYALASRYGMACFRLCLYPMPEHGPKVRA